MTGFIFLLAIVNLILGYSAALALVEPPLWSGLFDHLRRHPEPEGEQPASSEAPEAGTPPTPDAESESGSPANSPGYAVPGMEQLPADWVTLLAAEGVVAETFVEGVAHVLRLEVGRYREQLVATELSTRACADDRDAESLKRLLDNLRRINQDWLDKQTAAADLLSQRNGQMGDHESAAAGLEQTLLDQSAQIREASTVLQSLDPASEAETRCKQLLDQITSLLNHAHSVRDGILDLLATLMRVGQTLDELGAAVQRDALTGLPNRIGLEMLLAGWWAADEQRTRLLSAIVIDVDRFGRLNQRLGTRTADRTVLAISRLILETLEKEQGFERLVRLGGQSFMILQGDTGPHQALTAAERLRQAIEAMTFDDAGTEFDLTISCGVIEVGHSESSLELVRRSREALRFAKKSGRNRCAIDKGQGPTLLDPPQFPVKGRVISLPTAARPAPAPASPLAQVANDTAAAVTESTPLPAGESGESTSSPGEG